jgi:hypothetical protein
LLHAPPGPYASSNWPRAPSLTTNSQTISTMLDPPISEPASTSQRFPVPLRRAAERPRASRSTPSSRGAAARRLRHHYTHSRAIWRARHAPTFRTPAGSAAASC